MYNNPAICLIGKRIVGKSWTIRHILNKLSTKNDEFY